MSFANKKPLKLNRV